MIRIQGLWKSFGRQPVLRGVDLDVATGEIMIVIGRSGGGKSVLLKHLLGLLRPDAGAVLVDGTDITKLRGAALEAVRRKYGVVFQGGALFDSMSVFDNVAFPLWEKTGLGAAEIAQKVEEKLSQVGLVDMGDKNPAEISGGMRKRVAIARALVTEPEIVFFDEPTTGLDPILVNTIHHLIQDLHRKFRFTAVMVSHEIPEIFEIADRVAMLHEGVIIETGDAGGAIRSERRGRVPDLDVKANDVGHQGIFAHAGTAEVDEIAPAGIILDPAGRRVVTECGIGGGHRIPSRPGDSCRESESGIRRLGVRVPTKIGSPDEFLRQAVSAAVWRRRAGRVGRVVETPAVVGIK
jgi:phospholipid/cholesterol/gamma-HCH transport system ATP-binding protein